jgi:hypothetical protein
VMLKHLVREDDLPSLRVSLQRATPRATGVQLVCD